MDVTDETGLSALDAARAAPHGDALVADGVTWSWGALGARVGAVMAALDARGLTPADRIALRAGNRVETVMVLLACITRGIPFVPLHPRWTQAETDRLVADAAVSLTLDDAAVDALAHAPDAVPSVRPAPSPDGVLAMLYTSGTTGQPKGAMLSRRAFAASAHASARNLGWLPEDRWLACMPLCHVGGLSILTRCLVARRCVVLTRGFSPEAVLAALATDRVTLASVVPTMLHALMAQDTHGVLARPRAVLVGGAAAPAALMARAAARGVRVLATYGLTEACSQVTAQAPRPTAYAQADSGRALEGVRVEVVDDHGHAVATGEVGRIRVRGPAVMTGYWRHPPLGDAWLDTGDLGSLTADGALQVHARRTDLVVTGGENVYPAEVEQALESLPGVARAMVFGVPDEAWGQVVAAALLAAGGVEPAAGEEADLAARVATVLASHKRPRRVCWVDAIPMRSTGKVDRAGGIAMFTARVRPWRTGG